MLILHGARLGRGSSGNLPSLCAGRRVPRGVAQRAGVCRGRAPHLHMLAALHRGFARQGVRRHDSAIEVIIDGWQPPEDKLIL